MKELRQQQTLLDDEATLVVNGEETTLVTPRFDDEETLVARPVEPLDAHAPVVSVPEQSPASVAQDYRSPYAPRRTLTLGFGLVLISVLVGGVLGGAGLYLYQRQSQSPAVSPAATQQPATSIDAAQAPVAPVQNQTAEPSNTEPASPTTEAPTAAAPNVEEPARPAPDAEVPAAAPARQPESIPAAERRTPPTESAPRRGKKGERDEEPERRPAPQPDDNAARTTQPEARRVDSIFYRPRRAERRQRRRRGSDDVDRVRRIFEGGP